MRRLIYDTPRKMIKSSICKANSLQNPDANHYSRFVTVETFLGYVLVLDFDWQHNFGKHMWTEFSIIIQGVKYSALVKEGKLSDRQIKWLATNFANNISGKNNKAIKMGCALHGVFSFCDNEGYSRCSNCKEIIDFEG